MSASIDQPEEICLLTKYFKTPASGIAAIPGQLNSKGVPYFTQ